MKTSIIIPAKIRVHLETLARAGSVHPNRYTGNGRFSKRSADYAKQINEWLLSNGFTINTDFEYSNDSPRLGHTGWHIRMKPERMTKLSEVINAPTKTNQ